MTRKDILLHAWDFSEDEGWYPPLFHALDGVDVETAAWRPQGAAANTIWETVVHLTFFKERLVHRLDGKTWTETESNDDTFRVDGSGEADWRQAVQRLHDAHRTLRERIAAFEEADLDRVFHGAPAGAQVLDLVVHDAYHTGQIILVRKLKGAWPERRSFL